MWEDKVAQREDGKIDYVLDLLNIPVWWYLIAFIISAFCWKIWKWDIGILAGYIFLMLCITALARGPSTDIHFQPKLFWSWKEWDSQGSQILANMAMFLPVGLLLGQRLSWKSVPIAVGLSFIIEILQRVTGRGLMEYDDVIHNTIGTLIGIGIISLIKTMIRKQNNES